MNILDLGALDEPLLVFGGPYSNLQAVQAVLALGFASDRMVCTGDLVAYCADAFDVVSVFMAQEIPVVKGNCEEQLANSAQDCGCGFEDGSTCSVLSRGWFAHADQQVSTGQRQWMGTRPDRIVFSQAGRRFVVIHGGASAINTFLWSSDGDAMFREEIALLRAQVGSFDAVLCGHSGIAFKRKIDGIDWINAGVIGMPENDGNSETRYVVLKNGRAEIKALHYDHKTAADAMVKAGLIQGYNSALQNGYWPSEDVLPETLRVSRGDDAPKPMI